MGWTKFDASNVCGCLAKGDPSVMPTRWWNRFYLRYLSLNVTKVTVYLVPEGIGKYRVGRKQLDGSAEIMDEFMDAGKFAIRNYHEDSIVFALDEKNRRIILLEIEESHDYCLPRHIPVV